MSPQIDVIKQIISENHISKEAIINEWEYFNIDHGPNEQFNPEIILSITQKIDRKTKGVYVYTYTDRDSVNLLYIGKSKDLPDRIRNHYRERFGDTGLPRWIQFWSQHQYNMRIYYKELEFEADAHLDEALRIIVERYLIAVLKPISESFYKSVK
jgi:hypothetical protein